MKPKTTFQFTEFDARRLFQPYEAWFNECWQRGFDDYNTRLSHPMDDPRARATMVQNSAIIHSRMTFGQFQDDVKTFEFWSRRLLRFPWAIVQFKKLTERLTLSNYRNPTADAFDRQERLEGISDLPRVTVGFSPNLTHTEFSVHVLLTKDHDANNWIYGISSNTKAATPDLFQSTDEPLEETVRRVRARGQSVRIDDDAAESQG